MVVPLLIAFLLAAAPPASVPPCSSGDVTTRIADTNNGAGHAQTTIALVNRSGHTCVLRPFPQLTFVHYSEPAHVSLSHYGNNPHDIVLPPNQSAATAFVFAVMTTDGRSCTEFADVLVGLPGGGLPLFVPVHANTCLGIEQSALTSPAPKTTITPYGDTAVAAEDRWWESQDCQPRLLHLTLVPERSKPRAADSLTVGVSHGKLFDPDRAIFATAEMSRGAVQTTICGRIHTIPYGVARAPISSVKTKQGVAFGMSPADAQRIDGPATVIPFDKDYSALHYQWSQRSERFDLTFLFYRSRLMAIDYADNPH